MNESQFIATPKIEKEGYLCSTFLDVMGDFTHVDEFVSNRSLSTWEKIIEIDEDKAIELMYACYDLMSPRERIDLLDNHTCGAFYASFADKVRSEIEDETFQLMYDPLWLSILSNSAIYNIKRKNTFNNLTDIFFKLSVLGCYSDKEIEAIDYMQVVLLGCYSFVSVKPEVLDWLSNNVADRWLFKIYFDTYDIALRAGCVTPEGRACMDKLKSRWQRLTLNARHQETINLAQPEVTTL